MEAAGQTPPASCCYLPVSAAESGRGPGRGGGDRPAGFRYLRGAGASPRAGCTAGVRHSTSYARRTGPMVAGRTKRRSLRIVALVAAAGPAVALVTACSVTGGTAGAGAAPRAH